MKKLILCIGFLAVCISASGLVTGQLLTQEDIEFQEFDNSQGAALSSDIEAEWPWESYNQWQCFRIAELSFDCAEYDQGILVPSLRIETEHQILFFDVHVEDRIECLQALTNWRDLIDGGTEVCIFAAKIPNVDLGMVGNKPQSLWYLSRLKRTAGYWNLVAKRSEFSVDF